MTEVTKHRPRTFCWTDLGTTDAAGAKGFYTGLFGWSAEDMPSGEAGTYTMFRLNGREAAAAYDMDDAQRSGGVPPRWLSYISVEDAAQETKDVAKLGGTLVSPPFDVLDAGRMAIIQDPTGAMVAVWEPRGHIGATIVGEPGSLSWNELATGDTKATASFYTRLFGWSAEREDMGAVTYTTFHEAGQPVAGMLTMSEDWGGGPSQWMVYFASTDCDRDAHRARELGGKVPLSPTDLPLGRVAVIQDPQGAVFSVIRLAAQG